MWSKLKAWGEIIRVEASKQGVSSRQQRFLIWGLLLLVIGLALSAGYNAARMEKAEEQIQNLENQLQW
jgi:hypothetical protein